jgi:Na+/melibiose symporter-like transporter
MVGPPLAAPLLFSVGVQWAIVVDALSYVVSFLAIRSLRLVSPAPVDPTEDTANQAGRAFFRDFGAGLRFFLNNAVLTTLLSTLAIVVMSGGAISTLNVFFLIDDLHTPDSLFGLLGLVTAVGSLAGALLAALLASRVGMVRCYWFALLAGGLLLLVYAQLTSFAPALVVLTLLGMVDVIPEVALGPLVLQATPREFLGRVSAVMQPSLSAVRLISVVLVGFLASSVLRGFHAHLLALSFDPVIAIFSGAGILILIAGVYAMISLRGISVQPATPETGDIE